MARDSEFAEQVAVAEDYARAQLEKRFFAASGGKDGDWKAAMQFLSRKYYEDWAQRRPEAIEIRKLLAHFTSLVTGTLAFVAAEKHDEFKVWFQAWIDRLLTDDRNE